MNKAKIENTLMDVINTEEYFKNPDFYNNATTAVQMGNLLYPVKRGTMNSPGFYQRGNCMGRFIDPPDVMRGEYSVDNTIDFTKADTIKDVIEKTMELKGLEREILTTPDNIFNPRIDEDDSIEMKALKEAIIDKNIDIDKYKARFGANFNNDKKLFNGGSITLTKLKSISNALDMKVELTLSNKGDDVANPMSQPISVILNSGEDDE